MLSAGTLTYVSPIGSDDGGADRQPRTLDEDAGEMCCIGPGQFAFIQTKERVRVPMDAIAFISVRAGFKFQGLINVSGFHVDPGWDQKLVFAVFNASGSDFRFGAGERLFQIWYASLDKAHEMFKPKLGHPGIEPKIIRNLGKTDITLQSLDKRLTEAENNHMKRMTFMEVIRNLLIAILIALFLIIVNSILEWSKRGSSSPAVVIERVSSSTEGSSTILRLGAAESRTYSQDQAASSPNDTPKMPSLSLTSASRGTKPEKLLIDHGGS